MCLAVTPVAGDAGQGARPVRRRDRHVRDGGAADGARGDRGREGRVPRHLPVSAARTSRRSSSPARTTGAPGWSTSSPAATSRRSAPTPASRPTRRSTGSSAMRLTAGIPPSSVVSPAATSAPAAAAIGAERRDRLPDAGGAAAAGRSHEEENKRAIAVEGLVRTGDVVLRELEGLEGARRLHPNAGVHHRPEHRVVPARRHRPERPGHHGRPAGRRWA
jgi:hypothetical protein